MTEQKQPQAGEWWQKDDTRVCIVGTKKNGLTVGEMQSGTLIPFMSIHGWRHLPDCDSFDWQPAADLPPVPPQPKRVPVRLWVSHRLESEHGDWPMRCTPASEEFDDGGRSPWLEIRHDGYKFFVEVQQ